MNTTHRVLSSLMILATSLVAPGCASSADRAVVVNVPNASQDLGVSVSGSGEVRGAPDLAIITLGMRSRAAQAQDAIGEVARVMASLTAGLQAQGVAEKDIRTEQTSLYEERNELVMPPQPMPSKSSSRHQAAESLPAAIPAVHYVATNTISITVRDLSAVGKLISFATASGANEVQNVMLSVEDSSALRAAAREKAVADARAQATQLAQLSGMALGDTLSIRTSGGGGFAPMMMAKEAMRDSTGGAMPFSPGELTVSEQVEMRFSLIPASK